MVLEPDTGRCVDKDAGLSRGVDCEIPHRLEGDGNKPFLTKDVKISFKNLGENHLPWIGKAWAITQLYDKGRENICILQSTHFSIGGESPYQVLRLEIQLYSS